MGNWLNDFIAGFLGFGETGLIQLPQIGRFYASSFYGYQIAVPERFGAFSNDRSPEMIFILANKDSPSPSVMIECLERSRERNSLESVKVSFHNMANQSDLDLRDEQYISIGEESAIEFRYIEQNVIFSRQVVILGPYEYRILGTWRSHSTADIYDEPGWVANCIDSFRLIEYGKYMING